MATGGENVAAPAIEGVMGIVCDEFECTCGPDVERTIRQLMRDTADVRETARSLNPYAEKVKYSDGMVSFEGRDNYRVLGPFFGSADGADAPTPAAATAQVRSVVTQDMGEKCTIKSTVEAQQLVVNVTDVYEINLISGKVISHTTDYAVENPLNPAAMFFQSRRSAAALKFAGNKISDSLDGLDGGASQEGDANYYPDPTNPNKFFQQEDNTFNDAVQVALILSVLWVFVKGLIAVNELGL